MTLAVGGTLNTKHTYTIKAMNKDDTDLNTCVDAHASFWVDPRYYIIFCIPIYCYTKIDNTKWQALKIWLLNALASIKGAYGSLTTTVFPFHTCIHKAWRLSKTTLTLKAPRKKKKHLKMSSAEVVCCK